MRSHRINLTRAEERCYKEEAVNHSPISMDDHFQGAPAMDFLIQVHPA